MVNRLEHTNPESEVHEPELAHVHDSTTETTPDEEREATELSSAIEWPTLQPVRDHSQPQFITELRLFWRNNIRLSVPAVGCRDHLANERTFLAYLRTSLGVSMLGIVIAQLYRLEHAPKPSPVFGYYILGRPLAVLMQCAALIITIVGAIRFWRQQMAMARGKVHAGGAEVWTVIILMSAVLFALFALGVGVDIYKSVR